MASGKFFVIEGTDGSGKGEQFYRLVHRLKKEGYNTASFDFPRYEEPSSWFVSEYLKGSFGSLSSINPKTASLFYALDRYAASPQIKDALADGKVVISNRYVASNLGHQGSKFQDENERKEYFQWDNELEYNINCIPKPDLNIILHVPSEIAQKLVDQKAERKYLSGKKRDLHESDLAYLKRTEKVYQQLAVLFPNEFSVIECVEKGHLLGIDDIHEKVWGIIKTVLNK